MNRAEQMCGQLDAIHYGSSSAEQYISVQVSVDKSTQHTYEVSRATEVQKMVCGDGVYTDNNGIAHFCMSRVSSMSPSSPLLVVHMIEPQCVDMRNETPRQMQVEMIDMYCPRKRPQKRQILIPELFEDYTIVEECEHKLFGRINIHIIVVDVQPLEKLLVLPSQIVFVGFVREARTLPMLPSHKTPNCQRHREFASESYAALTDDAVKQLLLKYCANEYYVSIAGGGMKTCTAGMTLLQVVSEFRGKLLGVCGVSGGSWGMMYHVSSFATDKRGLERVQALISQIELGWKTLVKSKSSADQEKLQELLTHIQNATSFLTNDQLNYIKQIIKVVGEFECDWLKFIQSWLFKEWQMQEAYKDKTLIFGCTAFEEGYLIDTKARKGVKRLMEAGRRAVVHTVRTSMNIAPKTTAAAAAIVVGPPIAACSLAAKGLRMFRASTELPCAPIAFKYHDNQCTVCDFQTFDSKGNKLMVAEDVQITKASAISSAAAAGFASTRFIENLLKNKMALVSRQVAQTLNAVLPNNYPMLIIPIGMSTGCNERVEDSDDSEESNHRQKRPKI